MPGGRWLKCPLLTPSTPISCILKESKENHSWQPAHASASNLKTVQFSLLIIHWDGYPQWLGRILNTHYNTREQAADLIDGGDMSVCWTKDRWTGKKIAEYVTENVEVEEYGPQYYSQRGEDCPPRYDETKEEFLSNGEEFSYIFTSAGWVCYDMNEFNDNDPEIVEIPAGNLAV